MLRELLYLWAEWQLGLIFISGGAAVLFSVIVTAAGLIESCTGLPTYRPLERAIDWVYDVLWPKVVAAVKEMRP